MSEEKLYAVKNDEGKYWDFDTSGFCVPHISGCLTTHSKKQAEIVANEQGGHVVTLIEEPEKVVLTKEQAEIVENAHDSGYPATEIFSGTDSGAGEERLLINAYVNGYTVKKEKKYLVYKVLGGKQKHEQFAQAYRSSVYPGTVSWILTNEVTNRSFAQFAEAEIENYGLQDCEKEKVTDDVD
ncbi:DUF1642 domain-containing protein [Lacticaseibacillus paracasei]|uniref:DUF1642 domain-containing protein n=1 Tax=Lacticaseibacillus paracasei TaxID=1597 RepID=UPI00272A0658|nr:DUF1642 domain-containing protein [Lacticaseibacillus paracasei]WKZ96840.1 DUF1642 domain-containing protein [Lacticaseibacillus paracasei]